MSMPVHRYETAEGVRWHWAEMGDGDPVVLLHGIPESWMCWKHQMPTLATQFRVLAFDLKGYGRSELAGTKNRVTNTQLGRIAMQLMELNSVPVAWVETLDALKNGLIDWHSA